METARRSSNALVLVAIGLGALAPSCLLTSDLRRLDRETDEAVMTPTDSGDGSEPAPPSTCPDTMVAIPRPSSGSFCIDAREVSVADYRAFLGSSPDVTKQDAVCTWNTSFVPPGSGDCAGYDAMTAPAERPVVCVDWCDAQAYCQSMNKRLCGSLDPALATNPFRDGDFESSEWFSACSAGGSKVYPYGDTFDASRCIDRATAPQSRSSSGCEGGYSGLHDMSGNVSEWDNSCDQGADPRADGCRARGGAFWAANNPPAPALLRCDAAQGGRRTSVYNDRGFRCCKSP